MMECRRALMCESEYWGGCRGVRVDYRGGTTGRHNVLMATMDRF